MVKKIQNILGMVNDMNLRIVFARFIIRIGDFIKSSAMMVMSSKDLVEFSRQSYAREKVVVDWSRPELVDHGLDDDEKKLLAIVPLKQGRLLLLGVGGGREAIPLAKIGFQVTGVDFIPEMIYKAKQNAYRYGLSIDGLV